MRKHIFITALLALAIPALCPAQEKTANENGTWSMHFTQKDNSESIEEWSDLRFGMFIHWGPISQRGTEISWSRGDHLVPKAEYDNLFRTFNPTHFDAEEWARTAAEAGMKYVVLTTKHHDGFCLFDTKQTDYNVMNSPLGRDVVKELSEACRKYGLKFGTYYSTCDWFHPDFPLAGRGGRVRKETSDLDSYTVYLKRQIAELLLNYGPLEVLWFDVPQEFSEERGQDVIDFAHSIQPDIIVNSRTGAKGDFDNPEQRIGGFQNDRKWETCMTIGNQWAWKPEEDVKSLEQCLQALVRTAGGDGNLLFNVGPTPDGIIEPGQVARLKEMGDWLKDYGQSIYSTRGGPYKPADWGVCTHRGNKIFLHILSWQEDAVKITLPDIGVKVLSGKVINGPEAAVTAADGAYVVTLPKSALKPYDTIVELDMAGPVTGIPAVDMVSESKSFGKKVRPSSDSDPDWSPASSVVNGDWAGMIWSPDNADKDPWIEIDLGKEEKISKAVIYEKFNDIKAFRIEKQLPDGTWKTLAKGKTVGARKEIGWKETKATKVRFHITDFANAPEIAEIILL